MILTVTLNPTVNKTYTAGELITGHVNKMRTVMSSAGGKGVNVAKVLRQYDVPVCATGFLGGYGGDFIENDLKNRKVTCQFIRVNGETGNSMSILADNGYATEILEPGPEITEEQFQKFLKQYENLLSFCELVVLSGNVPRGLPENVYAVLIEKARMKGIKTLLDTGGESLRSGIAANPYLIKPNLKELEYIVGHKLSNREAVIEAALMVHQSGIAHVIVSMGKKGLISVSSGGYVYFAKAGRVPALNTVGCGDCVVASYAMSLYKKESIEQSMKRAAAISAANATTLQNIDVPKELARELSDSIAVEKLR